MKPQIVTLLLLVLTPSHAAAERRVLLAVGNNQGLAGEEPLRHAESDARRVAALFIALGDVRKADARVLNNAKPKNVEQALVGLGKGTKADTLIVYYSGHGGEAALHLAGEKLPLERLRRKVASFPAGMKILIVDACRSAGAARKKGWGLKKAVAISLAAPPGPRGSVELRAASMGEPSRESDELGGGVFTHYFLTGLRGAADLDSDGQVTLGEVYPFAYNRTLLRSTRAKAQVQHPHADLDYRGVGPLVLTRTSRASSALSFPQGSNVHYLVFRLPSSSVVAEVWADADRRVKVALPSGRYLVHRLGPGRYAATEVALTFGGERKLAAGSFRAYPRELLAQKGGGLLVHRHVIAARYGFVLNTGAEPGQRLSVGYGYNLGSFTIEGRALVGEIYADDVFREHRRRWVGGEALTTWHAGLGPLTASLGSGFSIQARQQLLRHLELGSDPVEESASYLAYGPLVEGGVDIYWGSWVATSLGVNMTLLMFKEIDGLAVTLDSSVWAGVSVAF